MPDGERVKVDLLDVRSYYSHGSTKRTLSGELYGCFRIRFCISAVILIGSLCLEFGELLVIPHC
ncbi:hypothetical protein Golax_022966 [Gossypium laxum]|uniref:Uncharacterized protein n=1 Tax=Gossypium laxum TaxID=34288 RepID=A0A7J9B5T1_9ROSI|nr:hypothetical protein [Gossypium laxum]